jgi:hypothetical protein
MTCSVKSRGRNRTDWAGSSSDRIRLGQFDSVRLSGRVRSGIQFFSVGSGRLSGHLMSDHFGFRIVSGRVGSVIGSSNVGLFWVSGRLMSGRVGYRVILSFGSYQVRSG